MALTNIKGPVSATLAVEVSDDNYNGTKSLLNQPVSQNLAFGSSAGQVNKFYSAELTIAGGATTSLQLDDASLEDLFGNGNTFTEIKSIRVSHASDTLASSISLQGDFMTTNFGASFSVNLVDGGMFLISNIESGYSVVTTTGDVIDLVNNDGSNAATVTVELFGD